MKRSEFIKYASVGGVLLSATPFGAFSKAKTSKIELYDLSVSSQVRHGNVIPISKFNNSKSWIDQISKTVYFANGISSSENDLHSIDILSGKDRVHLHVLKNTLTVSNLKEINEIHLSEPLNHKWEMASFRFKTYKTEAGENEINLSKGALLLNLSESALKLNKYVLKDNNYAFIAENTTEKINTKESLHLLIITKNNYA